MEISYSIMTLEEIELYQYYYFECDGDKRLLLRNCVEPEVAKYIMECLKEEE